MLRACVKKVDKFGKRLVQVGDLFTESTSLPKYLTSQVFFKHWFSAESNQRLWTYEQPGSAIFNPFASGFYTLTTAPNTNTNLRKDFSL